MDTAVLHEDILFDTIPLYRYPNLFFGLADSTLAEELSLLHLASWERPESWPRIEIDRSTDQEDMRAMETDRVCSGCDELGHEKVISKK